jgi:hypothetical protein
VKQIVKAAVVYFLIVFAAGFALGTIRELWVSSMIGTRAAETAEVPLMIGIGALAAIWVVARFGLRRQLGMRVAAGVLAVVLLLATELALVLPLRGLTLQEYLASRDPVAFAAYVVGLLFVALMPALVRGRRGADRPY